MKYVVLLLLLGSAGASDVWAYFHPEAVLSYSCDIQQANVGGIKGDTQLYWILTVRATRKPDYGDWAMSLGYYPPNPKGRTHAMKDCNQWMNEAEKRVNAAQKK